MRTRNAIKNAKKGRLKIDDKRDFTLKELNQLVDILKNEKDSPLYETLSTALYFGFNVGYEQGKEEAKNLSNVVG